MSDQIGLSLPKNGRQTTKPARKAKSPTNQKMSLGQKRAKKATPSQHQPKSKPQQTSNGDQGEQVTQLRARNGRLCFWLENGVFGNSFVDFQKKPVSAVDDGVRFAFIYIEEHVAGFSERDILLD